MRSFPPQLALAAALLSLAGCSGGGNAPRHDSANAMPATTQVAPLANALEPSFADWAERLDELLPIELAARLAGRPAGNARPSHYRPGLTLRYEWPGTRTQTYAGMEVPVHDRISLGVPRSGISRSFFRSRFQPLDAEQQARLQAEIERQAQQRGLDAASSRTAGDLADSISDRAPFEDITGLGDDAVWEVRKNGQTLHVLFRGSVMTIDVDLDDDPSVNKAVAVSLASELLARL